MYASLINLFIGGSETTSNTLNWALFYLSKDPELQDRAVAEIQTVIGNDRFPSLDDRPNTPLIEAIVMETHRISALAYNGIPRVANQDTTVGEYFIPKVKHILHHSVHFETDI